MNLDFNIIKAAVPMATAVSFLGLSTTPEKDDPTQLRADCPVCNKKRVLSMNTTLNKFSCFGTKPTSRGDVIALVAHTKGIGQRDAAILLQEQCIDKPKPKPKRKAKGGKPAPSGDYSIVDYMQQFDRV